jgi:cytoskeletal protein CcmA (bactofilin family)
MFTRDSRKARIDTLIGKGAQVQGELAFLGGLHLDGHVAGGVRSDGSREATLSVSQSGSIDGPVQAANVFLDGHVRGDIHATGRVVLGATAKVEGNVYYGVIEMALGAQIIGQLVRLAGAVPEPVAALASAS